MGRRSHTQALYLWMNGAFVGTWSARPHIGELLQYDSGWVASEQGRPLSLSLPFTPGNRPHRGDAVRAYFENLLPDSKNIRERVARRFRAGSTEAFALLAEVGRDCVGALQVLPDNVPPEDVQEVKATSLNDAEVAHVLRNTLAPCTTCSLPTRSSVQARTSYRHSRRRWQWLCAQRTRIGSCATFCVGIGWL